MCCCGKPTINGEPGAYSWDGKSFMTRQPSPPEIADGDELLYDCPGRCGGLDAHSHHFRLVSSKGQHALLVQHGGGRERIELGCVERVASKTGAWEALSETQRYWMLYAIYSVHRTAADVASARESVRWKQAAIDKRIKVRRRKHAATVEIVS